jgi:hypothetical protein
MNVANDHFIIDRETRVQMHNDELWGESPGDARSRMYANHSCSRQERIRGKGRYPAAMIRRGKHSIRDRHPLVGAVDHAGV